MRAALARSRANLNGGQVVTVTKNFRRRTGGHTANRTCFTFATCLAVDHVILAIGRNRRTLVIASVRTLSAPVRCAEALEIRPALAIIEAGITCFSIGRRESGVYFNKNRFSGETFQILVTMFQLLDSVSLRLWRSIKDSLPQPLHWSCEGSNEEN